MRNATVFNTSLDLSAVIKDCNRVSKKIEKLSDLVGNAKRKQYDQVLQEQLNTAPITSRLHDYYNLFTFPYAGIVSVCQSSINAFKELNKYDEQYCVHAWLNYQHKGETIPAHYHWKGLSGLDKTYVATAYIRAEGSCVTYVHPDGSADIDDCVDNTFVIYEDDGNIHNVSVWNKDEPRITISMDFVPMKYIPSTAYEMNTWMPVL